MTTAIEKIGIEKKIVRKCVQALLAAGFALNIDNMGEEQELAEPCAEFQTVFDAMMAADDDRLTVYKDGECIGWVWFVYGNMGWEVICDYTDNLDDVLKPVNAYAETFDK